MNPFLDKRSKSLTAKFNARRWPEAKIWAAITFRRAVTGMIQPTPDMYRFLLFVVTRIFPNEHYYT